MPKAPVSDIVTYYEEAGSGDALVLLTGLGADLQSWALTAPALAKQFHVVMPDNRGAGRTSAPDRPYAIAQMAGDVVALLDRLGIEKANLVGFSMGGLEAQAGVETRLPMAVATESAPPDPAQPKAGTLTTPRRKRRAYTPNFMRG